MLHYYVKKSYNEEPQEVKTPPNDHVWVYGTDITDDEQAHLAETYGLDMAILHDVRDQHELPRTEYKNETVYLFVRIPYKTARGAIATTPLLLAIKSGILVTLSSNGYFTPNDLFSSLKFSMRSNKHVAIQILAYIVRQYEHHVHHTRNYIQATMQQLETHQVANKDFVKFVTVEADLNEYTTNLTAIAGVLRRIYENKHGFFTATECDMLEDVILHSEQLAASSQNDARKLTSIRNVYTTISNNTLNQRMKTLTLLTLLIALPNLFYGMYGMNVELPFQKESWAYIAILSFTVAIVIAALFLVRRRRF